ncbi:MAG: hypothetical protein ABI333_02535 [bacterium]
MATITFLLDAPTEVEPATPTFDPDLGSGGRATNPASDIVLIFLLGRRRDL